MSPPGHSFSQSSRPRPFDVDWRERVTVLGTVGVAVLFLFFLGSRYLHDQTMELLRVVPMTFFVVGKFLPLWGITGKSSMGPYELGLVIWVMDTLTVVVFVYSFEAFYKLGPLRRRLDRLTTNVKLVLKVYPSMRRASVVGVVLFVLFPISGTGALAGSLIGLLLGMNRFVLIGAVSTGGFLGGGAMAILAVNFAGALERMQAATTSPTIRYSMTFALVAAVVAILLYLNRYFRRALAQAEADEVDGDSRAEEGI